MKEAAIYGNSEESKIKKKMRRNIYKTGDKDDSAYLFVVLYSLFSYLYDMMNKNCDSIFHNVPKVNSKMTAIHAVGQWTALSLIGG